MSPRPRYVLVIQLPRSTELRIEDAFLGHIGVTRPAMGYHVTLLGPFCLIKGSAEVLSALIDQICHTMPSFDLQLAGVKAFSSADNHIAYLQVGSIEPLLYLRDRLLADLLSQDILVDPCPQIDTDVYLPHVTLSLELTYDELALLTESSSVRDFSATFTVNALALVAEQIGAPWRVEKVFPLGNGMSE